MGEIEWGKCEICDNKGQLHRKYYMYGIKCECCSNEHFEIVWHCENCEPKDPGVRKIQLSNKLKHKI
jgi:hypothetical protein